MQKSDDSYNTALYGGWPESLRRMASKMRRENMSDRDAVDLEIAAGVFERALREINRLNREESSAKVADAQGLRMRDLGKFFRGIDDTADPVVSRPLTTEEGKASQKKMMESRIILSVWTRLDALERTVYGEVRGNE